MAESDKNILITPATNTANNPSIVYTSGNNALQPITMQVLGDGWLTYYSNTGQIFSLTPNTSVYVMLINDASALPMLEAFANSVIRIGGTAGAKLVLGPGPVSPREPVLTANGAIDQTGNTYFRVGNVTTTQRDALTANVGMIVYNRTLGAFQGYVSNSTFTGWTNLRA